MRKMINLLKKFSSRSDIMITLLGIALLILLIIVYTIPGNKLVILFACICCGLLNVMQGLKYRNYKNKTTSALSYIMLGIVIIVVGFLIVNLG